MAFPYWLKGALIVTALDIGYWLFIIYRSAQAHTLIGNIRILLGLLMGFVSLVPAFVVGAVLGLIVGYVVRKISNHQNP